MTARRTIPTIAAVAVVVAVIVSVRLGDHQHTAEGSATVQRQQPGLTATNRAAIIHVARAFTVAITNGDAARRDAALSGVLSTALAGQLDARTPTPTAATGNSTVSVESVTVQPGPPVTALVLSTLTIDSPGRSSVSVPETWTLTVVPTSLGWRIERVLA